jgi:hypothetical protein
MQLHEVFASQLDMIEEVMRKSKEANTLEAVAPGQETEGDIEQDCVEPRDDEEGVRRYGC